MGYSGSLGKLIQEKKPEVENLISSCSINDLIRILDAGALFALPLIALLQMLDDAAVLLVLQRRHSGSASFYIQLISSRDIFFCCEISFTDWQ
jgi:hypothetical protein